MTPTEWTNLVRDGGLAIAVVVLGYVVVRLDGRVETLHAGRLADEKEKGSFVLGLLERVTDAMREHR